MNKDKFWEIIERTKDINSEIMHSNLTKEIEILSKKEILMFRSYINGYIEVVDQSIWVYMACKVINGYVSDDTGLYFSLWLISQGETILLKTLNDPDSISELPEIPFGNAEYEMLMGIGFEEDEENLEEMDEELLESKDWGVMVIRSVHKNIIQEIIPTIKYKNGKKYGDYESLEDGMEDIKNILPKLIKRAEKEQFDWKK